jgi:hypothetical protein
MSSLAFNSKNMVSSGIADHYFRDNQPTVLSNIYQSDCNIATWKRALSPQIVSSVNNFLISNNRFQLLTALSPQDAFSRIHQALGGSDVMSPLSENIAELVDMFCCLFDLEKAGLRLMALDKAMCPRFHADKVFCRLVTTYQGSATQWLPHNNIDHSKLGHGSNGKSDEQSGLFRTASDIQQLELGDVALLKGDAWEGNEGAGLVHRSPALIDGEQRLLLTLDIA